MSTQEAGATIRGAHTPSSPRKALIFSTVGIALFMAGIDQTIVASALPAIQRDFASGLAWTSWTITIYALGQVLVMPLAGRLSDLYGRKLIFLVAAGVFGVASICCGFAGSIEWLIVFRALQAVGGGAFMPSASGIVSDSFGANRDRALGMFTSVFPIGAVLGPLLGGFLVSIASWRMIFLVNVPVVVALIALGLVILPHGTRQVSRRLDLLGAALLGGFLLASMLGIALIGEETTGSMGLAAVSEVAAGLLLVGFILRIRHARDPFIPPAFLVGHGFGIMNLVNFFHGAAAIGFVALVPLYAQDRFAFTALAAGTLLSSRALGIILVAGVATMMMRRTGYRLPMVVGTTIAAAGLAGLGLVPESVDPFAWLLVASGIVGLGIGLAIPASNNAALQRAPDSVAAISGLRGMFRQSGAIIAVSIATAAAARSADPGTALAITCLVFAGLMLVVVPLIFLVPDHRGNW